MTFVSSARHNETILVWLRPYKWKCWQIASELGCRIAGTLNREKFQQDDNFVYFPQKFTFFDKYFLFVNPTDFFSNDPVKNDLFKIATYLFLVNKTGGQEKVWLVFMVDVKRALPSFGSESRIYRMNFLSSWSQVRTCSAILISHRFFTFKVLSLLTQ